MTEVGLVREHFVLAGALDIGLTGIPEGPHLGLHLVQRQEPLIGGALCPLLVSLHQGGHGLSFRVSRAGVPSTPEAPLARSQKGSGFRPRGDGWLPRRTSAAPALVG